MNKRIKKVTNFNTKIVLFSFLIIILSISASFFIKKSFTILNKQIITYQERSAVDYKVYLKENDFYENDYLTKDMVYVANLIDRIDVDFDYVFRIDKNADIDFDYQIIGKLVITDKNKGKSFFEKDYVLLDSTSEEMRDNAFQLIRKKVSIDYGEYNALANQFRNKYGVDAVSNLIVYFKINEKSLDDKLNINNSNDLSLTIPLTEKAINITMNYSEVNKISKLVSDNKFVIKNSIYLIVGSIFGLLDFYVIYKYFRLFMSVRKKPSSYDRKIKKILREYDRLIVETTTSPNIDNKNIVKIANFQELLDVRDNLKLPIKYYNIEPHQSSCFYIDHGDEIYFYKVER